MHILKLVLFIFTLGLFSSCNTKEKKTETQVIDEEVIHSEAANTLSESAKLVNETIIAHGGELYNSANYSFVFREQLYHFKNEGSNYEYTKMYKRGDSLIMDVLRNGEFFRTVNNQLVALSDKDIASGTGALNSVIYFATLPYKLNDKAVNSKYIETTTIKGENYDAIQVTFNKEGGGEDHDDEYFYWINKDTKKVDYLAYNYSVNDGGVRFRAAYNKRVIAGITFQDYINYKAKVGTPLKDLPMLFEGNQLKELSKIETEHVTHSNTNEIKN